jgi:hypothetical protein
LVDLSGAKPVQYFFVYIEDRDWSSFLFSCSYKTSNFFSEYSNSTPPMCMDTISYIYVLQVSNSNPGCPKFYGNIPRYSARHLEANGSKPGQGAVMIFFKIEKTEANW